MAISTPLSGAPLRAITHYIWLPESSITGQPFKVPRDEYWDGQTQVIDGKRYIVINERHWCGWPQPDEERLECGHIQPVKAARGSKYYNRRRRCLQCALEAT